MTDAPDFFTLAGLLVRAHAQGELDEDDGTITVNLDTLADDIASRLEAASGVALRAILATVPLDDAMLERVITAIAAAERAP